MKQNFESMVTQDFYTITNDLLSGQTEYVSLREVATSVAEVVEQCHFIVRYDEQTQPMIDAAMLRNPYEEECTEEVLQTIAELHTGTYVILHNSMCRPVTLSELTDATAEPVEVLSYDYLVEMAARSLEFMVGFGDSERKRYFLAMGAAYALARATETDLLSSAFVVRFFGDVANTMAENKSNIQRDGEEG